MKKTTTTTTTTAVYVATKSTDTMTYYNDLAIAGKAQAFVVSDTCIKFIVPTELVKA